MSRAVPHIAVVGAGWAGCAAAVRAMQRGARVTLYEAGRTAGGRARSISLPETPDTALDNGQHILIGAYVETLALMRTVGVSPEALLLRLPLDLRTPDGRGLHLPTTTTSGQLAALQAIVRARGWSLAEKWSLLRTTAQWKHRRFTCPDHQSVADLCQNLGAAVMNGLIEPLCVAAFNSAPHETSGAVFLRVLRDALFSVKGASDVLIARESLGKVLPEPTLDWLKAHGARVLMGKRVHTLEKSMQGWRLQLGHEWSDDAYDRVILACQAGESARLVQEWAQQHESPPDSKMSAAQSWSQQAHALRHAPIATVYAWCQTSASAHLPPMQALTYTSANEAQFVFHHANRQRKLANGQTQSLLAFVASHCHDDRRALEHAVGVQAHKQLGLQSLQIIRTVMDKRATFVCTPLVSRPSVQITQGLLACGDYVQGPYPATLEGAVRSGLAAADACFVT